MNVFFLKKGDWVNGKILSIDEIDKSWKLFEHTTLEIFRAIFLNQFAVRPCLEGLQNL